MTTPITFSTKIDGKQIAVTVHSGGKSATRYVRIATQYGPLLKNEPSLMAEALRQVNEKRDGMEPMDFLKWADNACVHV